MKFRGSRRRECAGGRWRGADRASQTESAGRAAPTWPIPVAPPGYTHLGNWANLAQFVTGLIVGSGGTNGAFATASAASGGPCRSRTRAPRMGNIGHFESASPGNGLGKSADRSTAFEPVLESLLLT
jgi:hypothetical protein